MRRRRKQWGSRSEAHLLCAVKVPKLGCVPSLMERKHWSSRSVALVECANVDCALP